jgi:hypothetical protein
MNGDTEHALLAVGDSVVISKKHRDPNIRGAAAVITKVHPSGSYTVDLKLDGSSRLTRHVCLLTKDPEKLQRYQLVALE